MRMIICLCFWINAKFRSRFSYVFAYYYCLCWVLFSFFFFLFCQIVQRNTSTDECMHWLYTRTRTLSRVWRSEHNSSISSCTAFALQFTAQTRTPISIDTHRLAVEQRLSLIWLAHKMALSEESLCLRPLRGTAATQRIHTTQAHDCTWRKIFFILLNTNKHGHDPRYVIHVANEWCV